MFGLSWKQIGVVAVVGGGVAYIIDSMLHVQIPKEAAPAVKASLLNANATLPKPLDPKIFDRVA